MMRYEEPHIEVVSLFVGSAAPCIASDTVKSTKLLKSPPAWNLFVLSLLSDVDVEHKYSTLRISKGQRKFTGFEGAQSPATLCEGMKDPEKEKESPSSDRLLIRGIWHETRGSRTSALPE